MDLVIYFTHVYLVYTSIRIIIHTISLPLQSLTNSKTNWSFLAFVVKKLYQMMIFGKPQ